jgi:hypothetical protein
MATTTVRPPHALQTAADSSRQKMMKNAIMQSSQIQESVYLLTLRGGALLLVHSFLILWFKIHTFHVSNTSSWSLDIVSLAYVYVSHYLTFRQAKKLLKSFSEP